MFDNVYIFSIALFLGVVGLIYSADYFVEGSATIARKLGVMPLVIGLTIVALGTSAPELFVSVMAALEGSSNLAVGNGIGSNIANIALVLGCTAIVAKVEMADNLIKRQIPILIAITLATSWVLYDAQITRVEGLLLLVSLAVYIFYTIISANSNGGDVTELDAENVSGGDIEYSSSWVCLKIILGLLGLILASKLLVWGAQNIARNFEVSEFIIGLTVIAVGTSLPELATSIIGALRGHRDIAIGNIIGSNIFNLLGVVGLAAFITPTTFDAQVFGRDYLTMLLLTLFIGLLYFPKIPIMKKYFPVLNAKGQIGIGRIGGIFLLACYIMYYWWLI